MVQKCNEIYNRLCLQMGSNHKEQGWISVYKFVIKSAQFLPQLLEGTAFYASLHLASTEGPFSEAFSACLAFVFPVVPIQIFRNYLKFHRIGIVSISSFKNHAYGQHSVLLYACGSGVSILYHEFNFSFYIFLCI